MLRRSATAAVLAAVVMTVVGGCGGQRTIVGDPGGDAPSSGAASATSAPPSASGSPTASDASSPSSVATPSAPAQAEVRACLFDPAQVSDALGGSWRVLSQRPSGCNFTNTKAAVLGVQQLAGPSPAAALAAAKSSCTSAERPVPGIASAFVCVEEQTIGANVVGAAVSGNHAWQALLVSSATTHGAELDAIAALIGELGR